MKKSKKKTLEEKPNKLTLPEEVKKKIAGLLLFLLAIIVALSFFEKAGRVGGIIFSGLSFLIGKTVFVLPLILILAGLVFLLTRYKKFFLAEILAISLLILGISGILGIFNLETQNVQLLANNLAGGWLGYLVSRPFFKFFGFWLSQIIFISLIFVSGLIFWYLLKPSSQPIALREKKKEPGLIKRIFTPSFKVKEIEPPPTTFEEIKKGKEIPQESLSGLKEEPINLTTKSGEFSYQSPPLELLESEKEKPTAGDIRINSAIIKKTLENFEIPVEMSEVNVGPTVTQYTLKPAEGIKLSKITVLSSDLALALASHPVRIEAPIPGKPLVGIEIPNKIRAKVRLRDLLSHPQFQNSSSNLAFTLGRDVSGYPIYADLARMPHLLVGGSTGTGKTIFLNNLILSLVYRNPPETLRFILIDPKRVEFPVYNELPHLLLPVIFGVQKTINTLKWLIVEMERRFDILANSNSRDIARYNEKVLKSEEAPLPYIILIIDELADLMAARGKEMEAGIIRLAQMARAVGIHLVLATQRPSVEVITGLIKANITSRITFQVASQVDSRTILDMAGAEKLLGLGDMLFVSAEIIKPKRIQCAYVTEKEVKRVIDWLKSIPAPNLGAELPLSEETFEEEIPSFLQKTGVELEIGEDPLYEEAKRVVIEARKASASLLQRKLRIGYARAARLIDILEERGVVGPGEGAKPREVYLEENEQ